MTLDYLHIERTIVRLVNEHKKELSLQLLKMDLRGARVAVQGFGNVGEATARLLYEAGARVVAITDVRL